MELDPVSTVAPPATNPPLTSAPPKTATSIVGQSARVEFLAMTRGAIVLYIAVDHVVHVFRQPDWYTSPAGKTLFQIYASLDLATTGTRLPILFFMAGLFLQRSLTRGTKRFVLARAKSLLWPMALWGLVQAALFASVPGLTPWQGQLERDGLLQLQASVGSAQLVPALRSWWVISEQLWFVNTLALFLLLHLFLRHLPRVLFLALALIMLVASLFVAPPVPGSNPLLSALIAFGPHFFFFSLGTVMSDWVVKQQAHLSLIQTAIAACLFVGAAAAIMFAGSDMRFSWISLSGLPAIPLVLNAGKWLAKSPMRPLFHWVGEASLLVLCLHMLCIAFVLAIARSLGVASPPLLIVFGAVGGIGLCFMIDQALRRLGWSAALGFAGGSPLRGRALPASV